MMQVYSLKSTGSIFDSTAWRTSFRRRLEQKKSKAFKTLLFCVWIIRQRMAGKQDDVRVLQQQSAVSDDERRYRLRGVE